MQNRMSFLEVARQCYEGDSHCSTSRSLQTYARSDAHAEKGLANARSHQCASKHHQSWRNGAKRRTPSKGKWDEHGQGRGCLAHIDIPTGPQLVARVGKEGLLFSAGNNIGGWPTHQRAAVKSCHAVSVEEKSPP